MIEQRSLSQGKALCLLSGYGVVQVTGLDRLSWLHSLLSQNIKNLAPGESTEALLLDPTGHIEQQIFLIDDGQSSFLIVSSSKTESLLSWLSKMVFRMKVGVFDKSQDFQVVGATIKHSGLAATSNGIELVWKDSWPELTAGGFKYSSRSADYQWYLHLVASEQLAAKLTGKELAGTLAAEGLRVAAGRPLMDSECDEKTLPHELDLLTTAVHLSKGCYRGQETVAKVHNLGHPPRRLTFLHLDGSGHFLPEAGNEIKVTGEEKVRGRVTSVAQHFEMGPIALAILQRSVPEDAILEVLSSDGPISATQEVIVPQSAGAVANVPKLPRLSLNTRSKPPQS